MDVNTFPFCCGARLLVDFPYQGAEAMYYEDHKQQADTKKRVEAWLNTLGPGYPFDIIILNTFQIKSFGQILRDAGFLHMAENENTNHGRSIHLFLRKG